MKGNNRKWGLETKVKQLAFYPLALHGATTGRWATLGRQLCKTFACPIFLLRTLKGRGDVNVLSVHVEHVSLLLSLHNSVWQTSREMRLYFWRDRSPTHIFNLCCSFFLSAFDSRLGAFLVFLLFIRHFKTTKVLETSMFWGVTQLRVVIFVRPDFVDRADALNLDYRKEFSPTTTSETWIHGERTDTMALKAEVTLYRHDAYDSFSCRPFPSKHVNLSWLYAKRSLGCQTRHIYSQPGVIVLQWFLSAGKGCPMYRDSSTKKFY